MAGSIHQNGEFQPDESQVGLSFAVLNNLSSCGRQESSKTVQGTSSVEVFTRGEGTLQFESFVREGSAPRTKPLSRLYTIFTENISLSYTFD